jgi:hypothetical protein
MVCQLTRLKRLSLVDPNKDDSLLLQLSELKQLTHLDYMCEAKGVAMSREWQTFREVSL